MHCCADACVVLRGTILRQLMFFTMFASALVVCTDRPRDDSQRDGADEDKTADSTSGAAPQVVFINKPDDSSASRIIVAVIHSNWRTREYAYALIKGEGDCNSPAYSSWREFTVPITLTPEMLGGYGIKTLCAKGRGSDGSEQKIPTRHRWQLLPPVDAAAAADVPPDADSSSDTAATSTTPLPASAVVTTTRGLRLSDNVLKFASASREIKTVALMNIGKSQLEWSVTTTQGGGLLSVRKVAASAKDEPDDGSHWQAMDTSRPLPLSGTLARDSREQYLQFKLSDSDKTDYGGNQATTIAIGDGSGSSVELTAHILVPQLRITGSGNNIVKKVSDQVWQVNLSPTVREASLTIANAKAQGSLDDLSWDVFPYAWLPDWLDYVKSAGDLTIYLEGDCRLYPAASEDDELTLVIASNSDSTGVQARSFALTHAQQEIVWQEEGGVTKSKRAEWRTDDIRYVVVKYENENNTPCP